MTADHDEPTTVSPDDEDTPGWRRHAAESAIGLAVALLLLWTAIAAVTDVPFVYQGLGASSGPTRPPVASGSMRRQEKADRIGEILDELYPDPPVPLDHTENDNVGPVKIGRHLNERIGQLKHDPARHRRRRRWAGSRRAAFSAPGSGGACTTSTTESRAPQTGRR